MKKSILLLTIMLTAVCSAWALSVDEIVGKWESNSIKQDPTPEMPMAYTEKYVIVYQADGVADFQNEATFSFEIGQGAYADVFTRLSVKGSYTVEGDSISITFDPATASVKFTEDDIRFRGVNDPNQEQQMLAAMYPELNQSFQMMPEAACQEPFVINEVAVVGKKMVCKIDDTTVTFKLKKK